MKAAVACAAALLMPIAATPRVQAADSDPWFAHDKYLHGSVSAALSLTGYAAASSTTTDLRWRFGTGAALALTAGVGKELLDLGGPGDASWRDLTWDVVGTATGLAIAYMLDAYVF